MIDLANINEIFDKNKNLLIEMLINYYGQEYSEIIKKRLGNVFFDFSSTPEDDYKFLKMHSDEFDNQKKQLIELKYEKFARVSEECKKENRKLLLEYLKQNFLIENIDEDNLITLFMDDNFNTGYIDAFSTNSINLLNNADTPQSIKDNILHDQACFKMVVHFGNIKIKRLSSSSVDEIVKFIKTLQINYRNSVAKHSEYGKSIYNRAERELGIKLSFENISKLIFNTNPVAMTVSSKNSISVKDYHIIRVPISHMVNIGCEALDVSAMHEIIHKVETDENSVGIAMLDDTNSIANEIRTQKLAIKMTNELHKRGIFMFDNPNNFTLLGSSAYENLFPLVGDFFDKYEIIFSNCAINGVPEKLYDFFGESWEVFSEELNNIFSKHAHFYSKNKHIINDVNNDISKLIANMESFEKGENIHV